MKLPIGDPVKVAPWLMLMIAAGYFVFLLATWHQFQNDRLVRDEKINELLDRIPPKPASAE